MIKKKPIRHMHWGLDRSEESIIFEYIHANVFRTKNDYYLEEVTYIQSLLIVKRKRFAD
jgi:hypothetical protein